MMSKLRDRIEGQGFPHAVGELPFDVLFSSDFSAHIGEDGGPGSGNFGHRGRPGKVGGSGPGGGSQYRGGRSDIGYFSSKKDWLNGLTGEKQEEASKILKKNRELMKRALNAKKVIEDLRDQGLLTYQEAEKNIKEKGFENLREDMTPEEYILLCGESSDRIDMMMLAQNARNWNTYKDRLEAENLTDEERKITNWVRDNVTNLYDFPPYVAETYDRLKAKAMGLVKEIPPIPDAMLYRVGIKEKPPEPEIKNKRNTSWYGEASTRQFSEGRHMEYYMAQVIDQNVSHERPDTMHLSEEQFRKMGQDFADTLAYIPLKSNTIDVARYALREMEKASGFSLEQSDIDSLSDDDRKDILDAAKAFIQDDDREELTPEYLNKLYREISWNPLRKKSERLLAQDVFLVRLKMMSGIEPRPEDISEIVKKENERKAQEKLEKEKAKKRVEELIKRAEEIKKEDDKIWKEGVDHGDPMYAYQKDENLNASHMDDVIQGCNPYYSASKTLGDKRYTWNCQRCVMAFVARLRGYKVEAKPRRVSLGGRDPIFLDGGLKKIFAGATDDHVEGRTGDDQRKEVERLLTEWGNGAIGLVSVAWAKKSSAHIFVAMNDNGVIKYIDPQNPATDASKDLRTGEIQPWYTKMMRVDDKPFTNWIHQAIRPEGRKYEDNYDG